MATTRLGNQSSTTAADHWTPTAAGARCTDSLIHRAAAMTTLPGRVLGTKPAAFCRWVFGLLGTAPGDTLDDLYPGYGAVTCAWPPKPPTPTMTTAMPPAAPRRPRRLAGIPPPPGIPAPTYPSRHRR